MQQQLGQQVAKYLGDQLCTEVQIGRVDLGFLNRIILDDVVIYDQCHKQMVKAARLTTKIEITPLAIGRIVISSAQIFGAQFRLYKQSEHTPANFQFVLDSLASSDTTSHTPINLRINSFIMRHSTVSYDQWDVSPTPNRLNLKHLNFNGISAHIILKTLQDDSLSVNVKRFSCVEQSGVNVRRLAFHLTAGSHEAALRNFKLQTVSSDIRIDSLITAYAPQRLDETIQLSGVISESHVQPSEFAFLVPELKSYRHRIDLSSAFEYHDHTLFVPILQVSADNAELALRASGEYRHIANLKDTWNLDVREFRVGSGVLDFFSNNFIALPDEVSRIGDIQLKGYFTGDADGTMRTLADLTTDIGKLTVQGALKNDQQFEGSMQTDGVNIGKLLDNNKLGMVAANVSFSGKLKQHYAVKGLVGQFDYDGYSYSNISFDTNYGDDLLKGWMRVADPRVSARLEADVKVPTLNEAIGTVSIHDLRLPEKDYQLNYLTVKTGFNDDTHFIILNSDFAHATLTGDFDYATIVQSVSNAVSSKLPTLPGLPPVKDVSGNNFGLHMKMAKTDWLSKLFGVDFDIHQPLELTTSINDNTRQLMLDLNAPSFSYNGDRFQNARVDITSPGDTMFIDVALSRLLASGLPFELNIDGNAAANNLMMSLAWNNHSPNKPVSGQFNVKGQLYKNIDGKPEAHVRVMPSTIKIDNSEWLIEPSDIVYSTDRLLLDHFAVHNEGQYIKIDGKASSNKTDSVMIDLQGVEIAYILDLVSFDAVAFSGQCSGRALLTEVFEDPNASAWLTVEDFKFEDGRMGTLHAQVDWNKHAKQIDIKATANDGPEATTYINGYVSPDKDYIDLGISARGTYLDFMHSFTKSFVSSITGHAEGDLRLAGPLSAINLTGGLKVDGEATITPLNTTYTLKNDSITLAYNEIYLDSLLIFDKMGNKAYLSGGIHHQDLTNLSLDLYVNTDNFLGYDFHDFGDQSFYGTVYASGDVDIHMKGNDVNINCNVTPLKNTVFVYNAANPDAISRQEFISWKSPGKTDSVVVNGVGSEAVSPSSGGTNIYMNFLVNATPDGTMRLLMDAKTGDYITLNGSGTIQASYYNKGTFQMFGTYTVDHGIYDLTIQNIIKKNFQFQPNGTIVFSGDPYSAALNLQALYTVNNVSLSDLNIGNSFSSNSVRVNCLMNIGGQPSAPQVTFDLDMPNVNTDEKQMVRSLLSSQQEMNQQVLFLLGIGRFYNQGQNNANQQQRQTSLAMQSFLSGTLSTQINSVINQFVKNDDWNFGANISTGTEGWNNAEYEGMVAGRMLNNRLLINGQFGYRDNATKAKPSFIGDFDIRYLLLPNGNLALKVYNQTNDRYFTRSSLNTQGVGIIMKRDFNGLRDLFKKP